MKKVLIATDNYKLIKNMLPGKEEYRDQLKGINITNKHIEVTNGRCAARIDINLMSEPIAAGTYKIISATKYDKLHTELVLELREDTQYPDMAKIFPAMSGQDKIELEIHTNKECYWATSRAVIKLFKFTGNAYNGLYIDRMAHFNDTWTAYKLGTDKAVYLKNSAGTIDALMLPFKIN